MASRKRKLPNDAEDTTLQKEWDEISCPICMDHPHNAVLIQCTSHQKGCRSFICDTSYRHSNCLDRFKKLLPETITETTTTTTPPPVTDMELAGNGPPVTGDVENQSSSSSNCNLKCPLCRGGVDGWEVVEEVRQYLNLKSRSCSQETCSFSGNYRELRRHARRAHPAARPSDVDPTRERAWRRLEHQREYGDIVSAIRSAMPGAVVFGDYAIENGDNNNNNNNSNSNSENRERGVGEGGGSNSNNGHWWTAFFLFQMIGSMEPPPATDRRGGGGRVRVPTRHRRRRRLLWGESLLGLQEEEEDDDDDDDDSDDDDGDGDGDGDGDDDPFGLNLGNDDDGERRRSENPRRRRRRLTRYRSDDDRS